MKFYTWKDIERYCLIKRSEWKNEIFSMDVYPDELIVYKKDGITDEKAKDILFNIFASELVHLTNLQQILNRLKGRDMYAAIEKIVNPYYAVGDEIQDGHRNCS